MSSGMVPVELYTKKHIKIYLQNNFGDKPFFKPDHIFHNYFMLCLSQGVFTNPQRIPTYPEKIRVYITKWDYQRFGCWMSPKQMLWFNTHVDFYMKTVFRTYVDSYINHMPNPVLKDAFQYALTEMKITDDDWELETIKKDYYRSRKKRGKKLLYTK